MTLSFDIPCLPPKATSQMKGACRTGSGIRFFKKANVARAEKSLLCLLQPFAPASPLAGPLRLTMVWCFPWRASESKKTRALGSLPCDTRPDASNLVKMAEDVMTTLRFWNDDGQIAELIVSKQWGDWSGIKIRVQELNSKGL